MTKVYTWLYAVLLKGLQARKPVFGPKQDL